MSKQSKHQRQLSGGFATQPSGFAALIIFLSVNLYLKTKVMMLSENVSLQSAVYSATAERKGINNTPTSAEVVALMETAKNIYEPIFLQFGKIYISSFFRSKKLNRIIGGNKCSQHTKGEAMDLDRFTKADNKELFEFCKKNLNFDQLINEFDFSWVHISFSTKNRCNVLSSKKDKFGRTIYVPVY